IFRLADLLDPLGTRRVDLDRLIPGLNHGLQGGLLEVHGAAHGVDEVGDQIVAAFELDVDLLEGVERLVLERDEPVVCGDAPGCHHDENDQEYERPHVSSGFRSESLYAVLCGRSFASAWRTASATAGSSGPSRASGWAVSMWSSTPRPTGMRRHELAVSGSRAASRAIHAVSARPDLPRGGAPLLLRGSWSGPGIDAPRACAARRSSTSPVWSCMSLVMDARVAPSICRSLILSSWRK